MDQVSNRIFNSDLNDVLVNLKCVDRYKHFLYATFIPSNAEPSVYHETSHLPLSTYKDAVGLKKADIQVRNTAYLLHCYLNYICGLVAALIRIQQKWPYTQNLVVLLCKSTSATEFDKTFVLFMLMTGAWVFYIDIIYNNIKQCIMYKYLYMR